MARNPARYLSKYLSKTTSEIPNCDYAGHQDALPKQWQSRSGPMRRLVEFYTGRLPNSFGEFLSREYAMLEGLKLGFGRHWHPPSCDKYEILSFYPNSFESLMLIWERYISWLGVSPGPARSDGSVEKVLGVGGVAVLQPHGEGCGAVPVNGIRVTEQPLAPVSQQLDLIKWRRNETYVVA